MIFIAKPDLIFLHNSMGSFSVGFRFCVLAMACLLMGVLSGCDMGPATYTIRGTVSHQGNPISGGLINFKPAQGQALGGGLASDGSYEYRLPAGEYQVRIDTPPKIPEGWKEGDPEPKLGKREVPMKYGRFGTSGLTMTVQPSGDPQVFDFSLD